MTLSAPYKALERRLSRLEAVVSHEPPAEVKDGLMSREEIRALSDDDLRQLITAEELELGVIVDRFSPSAP